MPYRLASDHYTPHGVWPESGLLSGRLRWPSGILTIAGEANIANLNLTNPVVDTINFEGESLVISANGTTIGTFNKATNKLVVNNLYAGTLAVGSSLIVGLNAQYLNGHTASDFLLRDGSIAGSIASLSPIVAPTGVNDGELTTKKYVDDLIYAIDTTQATDYTVNNKLTTNRISSTSGNNLVLQNNNNTIATITSNGMVITRLNSVSDSTQVTGLNAQFLGGYDDNGIIAAAVPVATRPSFTIIRETQIAITNQTIFNLSNTYQVGLNTIMVYINGIRQFPDSYTETSSNIITFSSGLMAGDVVLFEIGVVPTGVTNAAANTSFSPVGTITSGNVQAALAEIDTRITNINIVPTNTSSSIYCYENFGGF